jgi:O-antigen/teichoic acid export membrane protein
MKTQLDRAPDLPPQLASRGSHGDPSSTAHFPSTADARSAGSKVAQATSNGSARAHPPTPGNAGGIGHARKRTGRDFHRLGLTTIALASSGSTTLIFNLVLVRVLAPGAYGDVARTFALGMGVAQLTMAGISPALARHIARGDGDEHRFSRARGGIRALGALAAAVSLLYFPLAFAGFAPTTVLSLCLGWALGLIYATYFGIKLILFVLNWSTRYAMLEFTSDVIFFITLAILAILAPTAAILAFSAAYAAFIVMSTRLISKNGSAVERIRPNRGLVAYAGWASVATYTSIGRFTIAVALTGVVAGSVTAGRLAALLAILMPFFLIPQAAGVLTFADVARAGAGVDVARSVQYMCRISAWAAALTISTCLLFAHDVVRIFLGSAYSSVTTAFVVLLLCVGPQIVASPISNAIAARGAVKLNAGFSAAAFVVMLVSLPPLVSTYGLLGAAIAFGLSMLVNGCSAIAIAHARFGVGVRDLAGVAVGIGVGVAATAFHGTPLVARVAVLLLVVAGPTTLALRRNKRLGERPVQ